MAARARGRLGARVGHERQDHHRGDDRRLPRARRPRRWCTTGPARTWPGAWPPRCSTPAASRGQLGLFEVDEAWLPQRGRRRSSRACCCCPTCSATSSTATASWSCWPTAGPSWSPRLDGRARFVLNADDPLVADLGRGRAGVTYFGVEDDSQALPGHAARRRLQALPQLRPRLRLRRDLPRPPRPLPLPQLRPRAARRRRSPPRACARRHARLARRRCAPRRGRSSSPSPSPASTTSTTRSPPPPPRSSWACRSATVGEALEGFGGAFGRVETIPVDGRAVSILLVKNPAGANEVLRTLTLEDGRLDLWLALNDRIADGRDVSWIWDADFEVLAGRVRRATCSGTRAEEMALRLKYAGIDAELVVERDLERSLDAAVASARRRAALRAAHLHGAARAARPARRGAAWPGGGRSERRGDLARRGVRRLRRRPRRSGASWPTRPAGPILDLGAGTGRVALDLAARGHDVTALDSDAALLDELAARARERGLQRRVRARRRPQPRADRPLLAGDRADAVRADPGRRRGARRAAGRRGRLPRARRRASPRRSPTSTRRSPPRTRAAAARRRARAAAGSTRACRSTSAPEPGGVAVEWLRQIVSPGGRADRGAPHAAARLAPAGASSSARRPPAACTRGTRRVPTPTAYIGSTVVVCRR